MLLALPPRATVSVVVPFLEEERNNAAENQWRLCNRQGANCMSRRPVLGWRRKFREGRTDVHDDEGQGRKSVASHDNFFEFADGVGQERRRFRISALSNIVPEMWR